MSILLLQKSFSHREAEGLIFTGTARPLCQHSHKGSEADKNLQNLSSSSLPCNVLWRGLERALWEEPHKGTVVPLPQKKKLLLRLLWCWKSSFWYCATGTDELATKETWLWLQCTSLDWQWGILSGGIRDLLGCETGKVRTPQKELMPFSQGNWAHQREPETLESLEIFPPPPQQSQSIPELHTMQIWPYFSLSSEAKQLIPSASPAWGRESCTWIMQ